MLSLYDIEGQLLKVFEEIEEQGGEITKEQEDYLAITESNFRKKLDDYAKLIKTFEAFVGNCKEEEKRIKARRKVYENRIESMKKIMVDAIERFGVDGKYIETGTFRLTARNSKSINVDEDRINKFTTYLGEFITEMANNGMLDVDDDIDFNGMIDVINTNIRDESENPEDFVPYTVGDLETVLLTISKQTTIKEMFEKNTKYLYAFGQDIFGKIEASVNKTDAKNNIEKLGIESSVAYIEENKSLMIK